MVALADRQEHVVVQTRDNAHADVRWHHADDRVRLAVEGHGVPRLRVSCKNAAPQAFAEHDDRRPPNPVPGRSEGPSQEWLSAKTEVARGTRPPIRPPPAPVRRA